MAFVRQNSFEDYLPQQRSPIYSSSSSSSEVSPSKSTPDEAIHHLSSFLDSAGVSGDNDGFPRSSAEAFTLQELKARYILEELKMKQEQRPNETCLMQPTYRIPTMDTTVKRGR